MDPGRGPSRLLAQYMYMWIKQTKRRFWAARLMSLEKDRVVNEPRGQMLMAVDSTVNECGLWKMLRAAEDPGGDCRLGFNSTLEPDLLR